MRRPISELVVLGGVVVVGAVVAACSSDDGKPSTPAVAADAAPAPTTEEAGTTEVPEAGGAKKAGGQDCEDDAECEIGTCYTTDRGARYCSPPCTAATAAQVCVSAPLDGTCNNKGFCRRPN